MDELLKAWKELMDSDISHDKGLLAVLPRHKIAAVAIAIEKLKKENEKEKIMQLNFGEGKVAISATRRLEDNALILEPNRGSGEIGSGVPTRPKGSLMVPDENCVILSFKNPESVQVLIDELLNVKSYFDSHLLERDTMRLQGAHEALGLPVPVVGIVTP